MTQLEAKKTRTVAATTMSTACRPATTPSTMGRLSRSGGNSARSNNSNANNNYNINNNNSRKVALKAHNANNKRDNSSPKTNDEGKDPNQPHMGPLAQGRRSGSDKRGNFQCPVSPSTQLLRSKA